MMVLMPAVCSAAMDSSSGYAERKRFSLTWKKFSGEVAATGWAQAAGRVAVGSGVALPQPRRKSAASSSGRGNQCIVKAGSVTVLSLIILQVKLCAWWLPADGRHRQFPKATSHWAERSIFPSRKKMSAAAKTSLAMSQSVPECPQAGARYKQTPRPSTGCNRWLPTVCFRKTKGGKATCQEETQRILPRR